jgi:uncharacterized protein (DUF2141 family)
MVATSRRGSRSLLEGLESRTLMSVTYGANLIVNPGAEKFTGKPTGYNIITPTGWTANGDPTIVPYGTPAFPSATGPGPSNRGKDFFSGGPNESETDFFQTINLSSIGSAIDAGQVKLALSAFLGGFSTQADNATLFLNFQSASKGFVSQVILGPETEAQRKGVTGLFSKSTTGTVPVGARFAQVQLHFERNAGSYNDGYADNLSLVLTKPAVKTGSIGGEVFGDKNGNGKLDKGETGLAKWKVFIDANNNGKLDSKEVSTTTDSKGNWSFKGLAPGTYIIRVVQQTKTKTTAPAGSEFTIKLAAGQSSTGHLFGEETLA